MIKNWKKLLLLTLISGLASAESISAKAKELGIDNLDLHLTSKFASLQGTPDRASKFSLSTMIESEITLTNDFKLFSKAGFRYETGTSRVDFNEKRYTPSSKLIYDYAYINYTPFKPITLQAGALDNTDDESTSALVNANVSFMGAREKLKFNAGPLGITLAATQAMPYNDDLNDNIGTVEEGTPKFFSEMATAELKIKDTVLRGQIGHFAYEDLSNSVAFNDRYYGNSVTGDTETTAAYDHNFEGWTYKAEVEFKITSYLEVAPSIEMVKNDEAIEGKNEGRVAQLKMKSEIRDHKVTILLGNFAIDTDTAPAFYNKTIFKNDYKGNSVRFSIENPENLKTVFSFVDRKAQNTNPGSNIYLQDEKVYSISLRKSYDIF
jgi:hypothetical protein